jgi:hypothetical protein
MGSELENMGKEILLSVPLCHQDLLEILKKTTEIVTQDGFQWDSNGAPNSRETDALTDLYVWSCLFICQFEVTKLWYIVL